ncbi:hypothetical protein YK48G_07860 [Lentilactobacillus fungorum]|uniref:DUF3923 domain-containing protein n=1 Tax=Lentilactobacillus fungorum TaxID=2201250 RepID=A0ABQ3VZB4_9LACO|nr:DUF3923 family protein [Lentilactobacillus fungorum]GHP13361.1 hypothetical protein YK48G_07860 [Lentilactobacillus fungorum]
MRWTGWRISNLVLALIFMIVSLVILIRKTDGAGVAQSPELRMITLMIWVGFVAALVVLEVIVRLVMRKRKQ